MSLKFQLSSDLISIEGKYNHSGYTSRHLRHRNEDVAFKTFFFYVDQQMSNRCQRQIQRFLLCKRKLSIYFLIWLRTLKGCSLSTEVTNNNRKTVCRHISSGKRLQVLKINNRNPDFYLIFILLIFQICR